MVGQIALALGLAAVAAAAGAVLLRSRRLRMIAREIATDRLEPPPERPALAAARARHEATYFELRGSRVPLDAWVPRVVGELSVTAEEARFVEGGVLLHHIPLSRVVEARLLPRFGELGTDVVGGILRVDWLRGGHQVTSVFAIDSSRKTVESIRREIHLRAGRALFAAPHLPTSV
jgi:hypothetical protein